MRFALILCAALALAAPASAGQRGDDRQSDLEAPATPQAVQKVFKFSRCVAQRYPSRAAKVLALDYRTPEYGDALRKLSQNKGLCVGLGYLHFSRVLMAGGMAETLLEREGVAGLSARISGEAKITARDDIEFTSLCVVRAAPDAVVALFATEPTSAEEKTALNAITPLLSGCVRGGLTVKFNRHGLRAVLALAAYRIAQSRAGTN